MNKISLWNNNRSSSADPVHHVKKVTHYHCNNIASGGTSTKPVSPSTCRQQAVAIPRYSHPTLRLNDEFHKISASPEHDSLQPSDSHSVPGNGNHTNCSNAFDCETLESSCSQHNNSNCKYDCSDAALLCTTVPNFVALLTIVNVIKSLNENDFMRNENVILDTRENRLYQTAHVKHSYSASCHTKTMAKRSIAFWISSYPRQQGGKNVYIYDLKSTQQQGIANAHLLFFIEYLQRQGNRIFILDGGWDKFKETYGSETELMESCMERELVDRYTFSPTNRESASEDVLNASASAINDFIWLGNERDAHDWDLLQRNNICYVLNVTNDVPNYFENKRCMTYHRLAASDSQNQDLLKFFDEAYQFMENAKAHSGRVLVHCWAGVSRSATIVISYIMRNQQLDPPCALDHVRNRRRIVAPNFNFMGQLERFYNTILKPEQECAECEDGSEISSDQSTPVNKDVAAVTWSQTESSDCQKTIVVSSPLPPVNRLLNCIPNKNKPLSVAPKCKKGLLGRGGVRIKITIPKSAPPPAHENKNPNGWNGFIFNDTYLHEEERQVTSFDFK